MEEYSVAGRDNHCKYMENYQFLISCKTNFLSYFNKMNLDLIKIEKKLLMVISAFLPNIL